MSNQAFKIRNKCVYQYSKDNESYNAYLSLKEKFEPDNESRIKINNYGNEDISKIKRREFAEIINHKYQAIPMLVQKIYINIPENRNVYIQNENAKFTHIFVEQEWKLKDTEEFLEDVACKTVNYIYDFIVNNKDKLNSDICYKADITMDHYSDDDKYRNKCKNNIKICIVNKRKVIRENYELLYFKKLEIPQ